MTARFPVIVADPPWQFRDMASRVAPSHAGTGRAYSHYETMTVEELCALDVKALAADDAFLFLWAPHAMVLEGAAQVVALAWGFTPKQEIVWVKMTESGEQPRFGGGHYARLCTEPMLLCRRGKAKVVRHDLPNIIFAPRGRHSAKPDESYRFIEALTGVDRFLELFARRKWSERWTVWGDQVKEGRMKKRYVVKFTDLYDHETRCVEIEAEPSEVEALVFELFHCDEVFAVWTEAEDDDPMQSGFVVRDLTRLRSKSVD